MAKRGRPRKPGSKNRNPKDGVTPELMQTVLETVRRLCRDDPAGVTGTEVGAALPHGNAQVFYALKSLVTEGDLIEQRGAREDLHSNSMCFRPVEESSI
jgi:hypothetical protein